MLILGFNGTFLRGIKLRFSVEIETSSAVPVARMIEEAARKIKAIHKDRDTTDNTKALGPPN